jgi:4-alpha-glucanotransferase
LLAWLGRSDSPLVIPWFEDLWLEDQGVNLPGTRSSDRPNWQRPMRRLLDDIFTDPQVNDFAALLQGARHPA